MSSWVTTLLVGATGLLAACGPVAAEKEPAGSGGAGDEADPGGSGSNGSGGAGSNGSGGLDARQACLDYCHQLNVNDCKDTEKDCPAFCDTWIEKAGAECEDEVAAIYACALPFASSCPREPPPSCEEESDEQEACLETYGCGSQLCSGTANNDGEACACEATCLGKRRETRCETPVGGTTTCVCLVDGVEVGTCEAEGAGRCPVKESCCQEYFNIP